MPSPSDLLLPRPRLLARIRQRHGARLVLLRAPAGFGKSTLLGQLRQAWMAESAACVLLQLEPADNDVSRFIARLRGALDDALDEAAGVQTVARRGSHAAEPHACTPDALLQAIERCDAPLALLMDDVEHLREPGVQALLRELMARLPPEAQLVLAGRGSPELGLGRLRARGELLELELDALRFSEDETRDYLAAQPLIELPPDGVAQLHRKTEGWPAGLAMAASVLQRLPAGNDFMRQLCASDQALAAYLREAVLDQLSYEAQQLLLRASVLRWIEPALCELLLPGCDASRILQRLAADMFLVTANPGLALGSAPVSAVSMAAALPPSGAAAGVGEGADAAPPVWRMHALFADVLRDRLMRTQPDLALRLHLIASGWYEQRGRIDAAVDHALAGGDVPHAAALLSRHAESFIEQGRMRWLSRCLSRMPAAVVASTSALRVAALWAEAFDRGPRIAWARLHEPADAWEQAHLAALRPLLLAMLDRYEEAAALPWPDVLSPADAPAPAGRDRTTPVSAFAAAVHSNAMAHVWSVAGPAGTRPQWLLDRARGLLTDNGDAASLVSPATHASIHASTQAATHASTHASTHAFTQAYTEAAEGLIDFHEGRLREAGARLRLASTGGRGGLPAHRRYNHAHGNVWAGVLYAATVYESGQLAEAQALLQACQPLVRDLALPDHMILTLGLSARISHAHGDVDGAMAQLQELEYLGLHRQLPRVVAAARLESAWLRVQQGQAAPARDAIDRAALPGVWERVAGLRLSAHQHEDMVIARARWRLAFDEGATELPALLRRELDHALSAGSGRRALKLRLLLAVALQRGGDWAAALAECRPLMASLAGEGYWRLVLDEGALPLALLQRLQSDQALDSRADPTQADHVRRLVAAMAATEPARPAGLEPEPPQAHGLTAQELRVLQLLADGYSNGAMAEKLQVSDSTVRTHLRSINLKLGVHSRGQALAAARRLAVIR
ncbi:LuxR family transcriptional regulator, maltose regulon positive regulatory protein [Roseateles sp. YR242]|uniref:LuxR C-terminal-related transcriptional regulator n=1 Tax=Roseateles sp. YR242 TaxID=1855305 RepID=UPI0008CDB40C|nr:LuxR C-terminal-related transcriptional regulator [Roseateles sp. YR242]SEL23142.1 LuxR family transcriptional regulator, maltose regulon positive regulatory protein [Roseateles sp. YR242]